MESISDVIKKYARRKNIETLKHIRLLDHIYRPPYSLCDEDGKEVVQVWTINHRNCLSEIISVFKTVLKETDYDDALVHAIFDDLRGFGYLLLLQDGHRKCIIQMLDDYMLCASDIFKELLKCGKEITKNDFAVFRDPLPSPDGNDTIQQERHIDWYLRTLDVYFHSLKARKEINYTNVYSIWEMLQDEKHTMEKASIEKSTVERYAIGIEKLAVENKDILRGYAEYERQQQEAWNR